MENCLGQMRCFEDGIALLKKACNVASPFDALLKINDRIDYAIC